ncbi:MAG: DUF3108 domain-containing protein [Myxococcales bacterium]|nr:DUF3108 domain-containing protein [Myxococcales bacterium]
MGRALVMVVVGAGCGAHVPRAPDGPPPEIELRHAFTVPGESFEYAAELRGLPVGRVVTAVGTPGWVEGQQALIVRSRGQSTGMVALLADLTWEQTTTLDVTRGGVILSREELWSSLAGEQHHETDATEPGALDVHAAIGALRAWRSQPGQAARMVVCFGHACFPLALRDAGHGFLVSAGEPAVRYEGVAEADEKVAFTGWVSDDVARVPLRFEAELPVFGRLVMELAHYTAPAD